MDFSKVTEIIIPQGKVLKITDVNNIVLWSGSKLPSIYQEVEWIAAEKNIGAYIKLGFTFDTSATVHMSQYLSDTKTTAYPFGASENSGVLRCMVSSPYSNGCSCYGSSGDAFQSVVTTTVTGKNEFEFSWKKGELKAINKTNESTSVTKNQAEYAMTNELYLFAQNYNGNLRYGGERKIGYFRYWNKNGELICDLVPCYRKSDKVIGMYDMIRKIFLTNVGSGSFIKGINVGKDFINQVSISIGTDGKVYNNGLGYKTGYRVRSGGDEAESEDVIITGFIPFKMNDVLRIYPPFNGGNTANTINFYDSDFTNLGQITDSKSEYGICATNASAYYTSVVDDASMLAYTDQMDSRIAYIRIGHNYKDILGYDATRFAVTLNEIL